MTKFLTLFDTQAAYDTAKSTLDLPNVSLIAETNAVAYKPYVPTPTETRVVAKYNVTSTSNSTPLSSSYGEGIETFSAMEIDGVAQPNVVSSYTFSTTGEHTVKYTLKDSTTVGMWAFWQTSTLTSVYIPNSVTSISDGVFQECTGITSVTIGDSVTYIGITSFTMCYNLTSVTIPNSVTSIANNAFLDCTGLTSVTIGSGITSIGDNAFNDCSGLTSVTIQATTPPTLGAMVFEQTNNCPIYVPSGSVSTYKAASGWSSYTSRIQAIP